MAITSDTVRTYYEEMTEPYLRYGGETLGWHAGLVENPEMSHGEGLLRANSMIVRGLGLNPEMRVLDCGCGVGGLAFFIAENFGTRVLGLTLSGEHVELAYEEADRRGLRHLVEFRAHDFCEPLEDAPTFDAVLAQDATCYVDDIPHYLRNVWNLVKPGGVWRVFDAFRTRKGENDGYDRWRQGIQEGWKVNEFDPVREVQEALVAAGFRDVAFMDISTQAYALARSFLAENLRLAVMDKLGGERPEAWAEESPTFVTHMAGNAAWAAGLLAGDICYGMMEARRPCPSGT